MRTRLGALSLPAVAILLLLSPSAFADVFAQAGQFQSGSKPVDEIHCAPDGRGKHPAVILLHGASPRAMAIHSLQSICADFATQGYYAMAVEYYSQTGAVGPAESREMAKSFPIWRAEIEAAIEALKSNPDVAPDRIGLVGYSLGAFLALSVGASDGSRIAAIVEYYGGMTPALRNGAATMPPVLILHGDADQIVPVAQAQRLEATLAEYHRPYEAHIYPGAKHAFNFQIPGWYDADFARDSWDRTLAFLAKYLSDSPTSARSAPATRPAN
jgi:carboxymethylenebutenolidase